MFASASVQATLLSVFAVFVTAVQNSLIRLVADHGIHAFEIVLFRNVFGLLSVLAVILWTERALPTTRHAVRLGLTCVVHVTSMMAGFLGVTLLPLNESAALGFAMPLFATIGAALFLGEDVRARRWSAVAIGFVGVLIILRPGSVPFSLGAGAILLSTMMGATTTLIFKAYSGIERGTTLVFYQCVFSSILAVPAAAYVWTTPDAFELFLLATNGVLGTISWLAFLRACKLVDASALMPYEFARLPFIAIFAYLLFGEVPNEWVWAGAALIFTSTLYIAHREALAARRAARGASR